MESHPPLVMPVGRSRGGSDSSPSTKPLQNLSFRPKPTPTQPEQLAKDIGDRLHVGGESHSNATRLNEYTIPSDGIRWDVIDCNISKLLGEEAYLWTTYHKTDAATYTLYSTRPPTLSQINDLKRWSTEADARERELDTNPNKSPREREEARLERLDRAREENRERDKRRWSREKQRRIVERELAWDERRREEAGRSWRKGELHQIIMIMEEDFSDSAQTHAAGRSHHNEADEVDEEEEEVSQRKRKRPATAFNETPVKITPSSGKTGRRYLQPISRKLKGKNRHQKRRNEMSQMVDELVDIEWEFQEGKSHEELLAQFLT